MADKKTIETEEFSPDIMTLLDEDGKEHEFEVVDELEKDGENYLALVPVFGEAEDALEDDGELVILRIVDEDEEGGEYLEAIDDEDEFNEISAIFMDRLADYFDFESDDDDDDEDDGDDDEDDDDDE